MDKNYYELLEIDRNASPEIIEKAYKTLAKKYHPDLQDALHKKDAEEILKKINEAYETLSDPEKKLIYDNKLDATNNNISKEDFENLYAQNQILQNELNNIKNTTNHDFEAFTNNSNSDDSSQFKNDRNQNLNNISNYNKNILKQKQAELEYQQQIQLAKEKAYYDAYIQDLKNRGYKIRYKKSLKDYVRGFITIIVICLVFIVLWHIPFIHNFFIDLYENNTIIHELVNLFSNLFNK